jgi:hypothetical protein
MRKFLTARWQDLVMANYAVTPELLRARVPHGTRLDLFDGKCFVSLVAFKFLNTHTLGIKIPWHTDFLEVNLRFYVTRETGGEVRRGVVFIKEIVPRSAISLVARYVYGEPYETWKMSLEERENELCYRWSKGVVENRLLVEYTGDLGVPASGSAGEFIIEHYWGYTRRGETHTDEYRVEHPKWALAEVNYAEIDVDFGATYGEQFAFLGDKEPDSILLARGSQVAVYKGQKII